jgi:hypothetical protein
LKEAPEAMFRVCPVKIGMSLHMEVFELRMRELYRLRAQEKKEQLLCLTGKRNM